MAVSMLNTLVPSPGGRSNEEPKKVKLSIVSDPSSTADATSAPPYQPSSSSHSTSAASASTTGATTVESTAMRDGSRSELSSSRPSGIAVTLESQSRSSQSQLFPKGTAAESESISIPGISDSGGTTTIPAAMSSRAPVKRAALHTRRPPGSDAGSSEEFDEDDISGGMVGLHVSGDGDTALSISLMNDTSLLNDTATSPTLATPHPSDSTAFDRRAGTEGESSTAFPLKSAHHSSAGMIEDGMHGSVYSSDTSQKFRNVGLEMTKKMGTFSRHSDTFQDMLEMGEEQRSWALSQLELKPDKLRDCSQDFRPVYSCVRPIVCHQSNTPFYAQCSTAKLGYCTWCRALRRGNAKTGSICMNCGERLTAKYHKWYPELVRLEPLEKERSASTYRKYKAIFEKYSISWVDESELDFVLKHYMLMKIYVSHPNINVDALHLERTYMIGVFAGREFSTGALARKLLKEGCKLVMFRADFPQYFEFLRPERAAVAENLNSIFFKGVNRCYLHSHIQNIEGWFDPSFITREDLSQHFKMMCDEVLKQTTKMRVPRGMAGAVPPASVTMPPSMAVSGGGPPGSVPGGPSSAPMGGSVAGSTGSSAGSAVTGRGGGPTLIPSTMGPRGGGAPHITDPGQSGRMLAPDILPRRPQSGPPRMTDPHRRDDLASIPHVAGGPGPSSAAAVAAAAASGMQIPPDLVHASMSAPGVSPAAAAAAAAAAAGGGVHLPGFAPGLQPGMQPGLLHSSAPMGISQFPSAAAAAGFPGSVGMAGGMHSATMAASVPGASSLSAISSVPSVPGVSGFAGMAGIPPSLLGPATGLKTPLITSGLYNPDWAAAGMYDNPRLVDHMSHESSVYPSSGTVTPFLQTPGAFAATAALNPALGLIYKEEILSRNPSAASSPAASVSLAHRTAGLQPTQSSGTGATTPQLTFPFFTPSGAGKGGSAVAYAQATFQQGVSGAPTSALMTPSPLKPASKPAGTIPSSLSGASPIPPPTVRLSLVDGSSSATSAISMKSLPTTKSE